MAAPRLALCVCILVLALLQLATAQTNTVYFSELFLCPNNVGSNNEWVLYPSAAATLTCPASALTSQPLTLNITSLAGAQKNSANSGMYVLSILRSKNVQSASITFSIVDAANRVLQPTKRIDVGTAVPSGRRLLGLADSQGGDAQSASRRLLKGSSGGGGGKGGSGAGRTGGGSGGFSSAGSGGRSYGYSSSALNSRYPGGYTRTSYGYSGYGAMYYGSPMFIMYPMYGGYGYGHGYGYHNQYSRSNSCSQYPDQAACVNHYSKCQVIDNNSTLLCESSATSQLTRDDIMTAAFDVQDAVFPIRLEFSQASVTFSSTAVASGRRVVPEAWDQPLHIALSEVDFDSNDDDSSWVWVVVGVVVGVVCLVCIIIVCCCCNKSDKYEAPVQYGGASGYTHSPQHADTNEIEMNQPAPAAVYSNDAPADPTPSYAVTGTPVVTDSLPASWQEVNEVDPHTQQPTGRIYYHNTVTDETSWERPLAGTIPEPPKPDYLHQA